MVCLVLYVYVHMRRVILRRWTGPMAYIDTEFTMTIGKFTVGDLRYTTSG